MKWKRAIKQEESVFQIPRSWVYNHYYEALNILFRIENSLRIFVYAVLKIKYKDGWCDINITSDDSESGSIKSIAKKRIIQNHNFGYLGHPVSSYMMFLTTGELLRIIYSDGYWPLFKDYFNGSRDVMKNKMDEISNIRNAIAHFRPIKDDDVDVLKQNSKHALTEIEYCLHNIFNIYENVPTNTTDKWYHELQVLGTDLCNMNLRQSKDEKWIKLSIEYKCPIILRSESSTYFNHNVLNIKTSSILSSYPKLSHNIISLTETLPYITFKALAASSYNKTLHFVVNKKTMEESIDDIKEDVSNLLRSIKEETDLIMQDNLARGKLVDTVNIYLNFDSEKQEYRANNTQFSCPVKEDDPSEYWGSMVYFFDHFISNSHKFPWMPTDIADFAFPED